MLAELIVYSLALYGFVTVCVQVYKRFSWWYKPKETPLYLLILLHNAESFVERLYRSLGAMSRTTGRPLCITFVDCASQDATVRMLELLTKEEPCVHILRQDSFDVQVSELRANLHPQAIVIDLRLTASFS